MPSQRGGDGGDAEPEGRGRRGCRARGEGTAGNRLPVAVEAGEKILPNGTDLGPPTVPGPAAVHALPRHPEQPCCGPIFPARALLASLPGQSPSRRRGPPGNHGRRPVDTQFAGSPKQVADRLEQLQEASGADEPIITTITHDHADRVRSFEPLAAEWQRR